MVVLRAYMYCLCFYIGWSLPCTFHFFSYGATLLSVSHMYKGIQENTKEHIATTSYVLATAYIGSVCKHGDLTILCIKFSHSEEEESDIIYTSERGPKPF